MDKSNKPFETEERGVGLCPDCAVETGTIFDGTDRTAAVSRLFETEQAAADALAHYTAQAREVESEPCRIGSRIAPESGGFRLDAEFEFCCQAEKVIFQFKTR